MRTEDGTLLALIHRVNLRKRSELSFSSTTGRHEATWRLASLSLQAGSTVRVLLKGIGNDQSRRIRRRRRSSSICVMPFFLTHIDPDCLPCISNRRVRKACPSYCTSTRWGRPIADTSEVRYRGHRTYTLPYLPSYSTFRYLYRTAGHCILIRSILLPCASKVTLEVGQVVYSHSHWHRYYPTCTYLTSTRPLGLSLHGWCVSRLAR